MMEKAIEERVSVAFCCEGGYARYGNIFVESVRSAKAETV